MSSTGLPFKAPHQADQLAQCDHLRLSLKRFCLFRRSANWYPPNPLPPHNPIGKNTPNRSKNGAKQDRRSHWIPPLLQGELEVYPGIARAAVTPFGKIAIKARLATYEKGLHLAIDNNFWLTNMVYFLLARACAADECMVWVFDI